MLAYLAGEREREAQQNALAVSGALGTAVDAELRATLGVLQSLAFSDELTVVQPVLRLRRLELSIAPEAEDLWVSGDEVRLVQVLHNLLGNAVKFTGPEGTMRLALQAAADGAEILVADSGVGMPPAVLERAFDLFCRATKCKSPTTPGWRSRCWTASCRTWQCSTSACPG